MLITVGIYFAIVFIIGILAGRVIKSSIDYYLGGKRFGPWFTSFKFASTWESGVKLVGTPGMAWSVGYPAFVMGMATPFGYLFSFRIYGQRLKVACDHFNVITVPNLLEKRYCSRTIRVLAAITILVGLGGSLVAQYKATGEVFSNILGRSYVQGLVIGVFIVGGYSIIGGYVASVWTDFMQGIVMILGSIVLFVTVAKAALGEFSFAVLFKMNGALAQVKPEMLEITGGGKMPVTQMFIILVITLLIGIAMPQQAVAIFSMRDKKVARSSLIICTIFSAILAWCLLPAGMMGRLILENEQVKNPDMVIPILVQQILQPVMAGIFIAAVLAAIMSTISGAIVVSASALTQDIMNIVAPKIYQKNQIVWDRSAAAFIVIIPLLLAIKPPSIIFWIIVFSFGFIVFTFLMPMLGVIGWKRATSKGAIIQMVVTMILIPIWSVIGAKIIPGVPALLAGLIVAPIVFIIASLLTQPTIQEMQVADNLWKSYHDK
jgi:sodium/proline symporter